MKNTLFKLRKFTDQNYNLIINYVLILSLIILMMPPGNWSSNEEQYLGAAWRRFSPDNLIQISALKDSANHRLIFEYLTNFGIEHIGFEWTHTTGRIIVALLYAASLVILFRSLRLSTVASCTIILTFVYLDEAILGGEWLFRGFEPKTLAYPLVFFSFSSSLKRRFGLSYILLAMATYFHFLVGGFWFIITFVCQLYWTRNFKKVFFASLKYLLACLPLFLMIIVVQLSAQEVVDSSYTASWIYSQRNAHHVAPFAHDLTLKKSWYRPIGFLFLLTIISGILYRYSGSKSEKEFSKLILGLNLYLILSVIISYFDKNGVLGKLYLFRPSSVTLLLTLCLYALFLKKLPRAKLISFAALGLIACLVIPNLQGYRLGYKSIVSTWKSWQINQPPTTINDLKPSPLEKIIESSNNNDIFLIDLALENDYLSFERKYNRPTLVARKFVPTTNSDIVRWFELLTMKQELFERGCPAKIMEKYPIKYLLSRNNRESINSCGNELFRNEKIKLIKIQN